MTVNPVGGSGEDDARDSACTPKWLAEIIGERWLDPCSNSRSHIQAIWKCPLELGANGLVNEDTESGCFLWVNGEAFHAGPDWLTFINPPYSRGQVIRWVRHYGHTDFVFLLRWAPDTEWFSELWPKCWGAWFPRKTAEHTGRINFDPPPGVTFSSNPFPHALYLASEPTGDFLDRLLANGYLMLNHERAGTTNSRAGSKAEGGAGSGGSRVRCFIGERCCEGKGPCPAFAAVGTGLAANYCRIKSKEYADAEADGIRRDSGGGAPPGIRNEVRGAVGVSEGAAAQGDRVSGREVQPEEVETCPRCEEPDGSCWCGIGR